MKIKAVVKETETVEYKEVKKAAELRAGSDDAIKWWNRLTAVALGAALLLGLVVGLTMGQIYGSDPEYVYEGGGEGYFTTSEAAPSQKIEGTIYYYRPEARGFVWGEEVSGVSPSVRIVLARPPRDAWVDGREVTDLFERRTTGPAIPWGLVGMQATIIGIAVLAFFGFWIKEARLRTLYIRDFVQYWAEHGRVMPPEDWDEEETTEE